MDGLTKKKAAFTVLMLVAGGTIYWLTKSLLGILLAILLAAVYLSKGEERKDVKRFRETWSGYLGT